VWTIAVDGIGDSDQPGISGLATTPSGEIVSVVSISGTILFDGMTIAPPSPGSHLLVTKLTAEGEVVWHTHRGGVGGNGASAVALSPSGEIAIVGYFDQLLDLGGDPLIGGDSHDVFVAALDATGNHLWSRGFGGAGADLAMGVAVGADGGVVVVGTFGGTIDCGTGPLTATAGDNGFVAKYAAGGAPLWSRALPGRTDSVALDANDNVLVTGRFSQSWDPVSGQTAPESGLGLAVVKLDPSGSALSKISAGGERAISIAVDASGTIALAGTRRWFRDSVDVGPGPSQTNQLGGFVRRVAP
jgi:hypothetical protein